MNYCNGCGFDEKCELAHKVHFCEDCKNYWWCSILSSCEANEFIECDNGFEPKEEDEEEEKKFYEDYYARW